LKTGRASLPWIALAAMVLFAVPSARLSGQSVTVSVADGLLHVRVPALTLIKGEPLARLKDGRSVRVDFDLAVLPKAAAPATAQARHTFVLSYDLWEERFAATHVTTPARSASHLTQRDVEAWCLERVTVPVAALGRQGRDTPIWVRLEYRVQDSDRARSADDDPGFTLRGLIDRLSQRQAGDPLRGAIDGGPFKLPPN
jgi:hypothetical protein